MDTDMAKRLEHSILAERDAALMAATPQGQMIGGIMKAIAPIISQFVNDAVEKRCKLIEKRITSLERKG